VDFDRADAIRKKTEVMTDDEYLDFLAAIIRIIGNEMNFIEAAEKYFQEKTN
jgi:hypothetical protein